MTDTTPPTPHDGVLFLNPEQALENAHRALADAQRVPAGHTRVQIDVPDEFLDEAEARYFTASEDPRVVQLRSIIQVLGAVIREHVPAGVQRNLAEQGLELVQMRANRGIFSPQLPE